VHSRSNGFAITCDVNGTINCNCRLTGMPDCTLTFDDPYKLDDCAFHPCVRFQRFETDQQLSFIPPDGKFKLLSFVARDCGLNLPIYVKPSVSFNGTSGHIDVMVVRAPPCASVRLRAQSTLRLPVCRDDLPAPTPTNSPAYPPLPTDDTSAMNETADD
jgi:hypothetical protein